VKEILSFYTIEADNVLVRTTMLLSGQSTYDYIAIKNCQS